MSRKLLIYLSSFVTVLALSLLVSNGVFASSEDFNETPEGNPVGNTTFAPYSEEIEFEIPSEDAPSTIKPMAIDFGGGTIMCRAYGTIGECNWTIKAPERITKSNVKVTLEKWHGFLSGGWKRYDSMTFNYPINRPRTTIRNQANFRITSGKYRAILGGTFTTTEHVYAPILHNKSHFEKN